MIWGSSRIGILARNTLVGIGKSRQYIRLRFRNSPHNRGHSFHNEALSSLGDNSRFRPDSPRHSSNRYLRRGHFPLGNFL